jgi:formylglycine-generating enzyme required for sulfatase activity/sugar lactone lactonase YvrE
VFISGFKSGCLLAVDGAFNPMNKLNGLSMKTLTLRFSVALLGLGHLAANSMADPLDQWIVLQAGTTSTLKAVAYGNNQFVAVGDAGTMVTSSDGTNWTSRPSGASATLWKVVYGNHRFVVVGDGGTLLSSPDGITWTHCNSGTSLSLFGAAFANGTFLVVGGPREQTRDIGDVALTSVDGLTWTGRNPGTEAVLGGWSVIAEYTWLTNLVGADSLFLETVGDFAVFRGGSSTSKFIRTSSDGIHWTQMNAAKPDGFVGLAYGYDVLVAVGSAGAIRARLGLSWLTCSSGITNSLWDIAFGNSAFVAVGEAGTLVTSPDGIAWSQRRSGTAQALYGIAAGNNTFVAVGNGGTVVQCEGQLADSTLPPQLRLQPQSQRVSSGATVTFNTSASGSQPLTYQWQKDLLNLLGATNDSLVLANVRITDSGSYRVSVSNRFGLVLSAAAVLLVTNPVNPVHYLSNVVTVSSWAGSGKGGFADGPAEQAQFSTPHGLCVDGEGNVFVADSGNHRIRKVNPAGNVSTIAGSGLSGYRDGRAETAMFCFPMGVCVDSHGIVYVADTGQSRIRKITPAGEVGTVAGSGLRGYVDGVGIDARFNFPQDLAADSAGNLFVADYGNHTIRKIALDGTVSTWAGNGAAGYANGLGATARLNEPGGITIDGSGNLYVGEWGNQRIRKISPAGQVTTLAGSGVAGFADGVGLQAQFSTPGWMVVDPLGNLFVAEHDNHAIRRVSSSGIVETVAGTGTIGFADGDGAHAQFWAPDGIGMTLGGVLYVTDQGNSRLRQIVVDTKGAVDQPPAWPPTIVQQPQGQSVAAGSRVTLSVSARGESPLRYQWQFQGVNIPGATNQTLSFEDVNYSRQGRYTVIVSNREGSVQSAEVQVTVRPWLRIVKQGDDLRLEYHLSLRWGQAAIYGAESPQGLHDSPSVLVTLGAQTDSGSVSLPDWATQAARFYVLAEGAFGSPDAAKWAWIPPGTFLSGSLEDIETQVTISYGFWMSRYEVTQEEYLAVMGKNPSFYLGGTCPVEAVSWFEATNYCGELTAQERGAGRLPDGYVYRLPTEAEWEYACRAGTTTLFSYGDDPDYSKLWSYAWYADNDRGLGPRPVGQKLPNLWGLNDLHGNVWEWCSDWYVPYPGGSVTDPQGPPTGSERVIRGGGCWDHPEYCTSAYRSSTFPDQRQNDIGFRCVLAPVRR